MLVYSGENSGGPIIDLVLVVKVRTRTIVSDISRPAARV